MATQPEIRIFAMFPSEPSDSQEEPSGWNWVHCLTFPVNTLQELQFSPKPYKWIRYATGVVVGAQGDLSYHKNLPDEVMDYDQGFPLESIDLYYHTNDDEKQKMFPIDPDMERKSFTGSDVTPRLGDFRTEIVERDQTCVLTGWSASHFCHAAHLLPHCKGDQYILSYTTHRSRDPAHNDIVDSIDDIRNGILLHMVTHHALGTNVAFLVTPNFAMSTADVDPALPPTEKRCTAHCFAPDLPLLGDPALHSGAAVRMPATLDQWPPDILFDAVYASTILSRFASPAIQGALGKWKTTFYPGKTTTGAGASHPTTVGGKAMTSERAEQQKEERNKRMENRNKRRGMVDDNPRNDYFDCLMFLPYILMPPERQEAVRREAAEKRAAREQSRVEDKVAGWARDVANASD